MKPELFVLKGIAIFFIVVVHMCSDFYNPMVRTSIHSVKDFMYLFIFASGFLFGFSKPKIASWSDCYAIILNKSVRLLVPYFTITAIILFCKYIAGMYFTLHAPVDGDFWKYILLGPDGGFTTFLWFIYVLYIIFIVVTLIRWLIPNNYIVLLILLAVYFIEIPGDYYFELDLVGFYLIFFYIGYWYATARHKAPDKHALYLCAVFFLVLFILLVYEQLILIRLETMLSAFSAIRFYYLLLGILLIYGFYYLSIFIAKKVGAVFKLLHYIGTYSPSIYLFHTIFMGAICTIARPYKQSEIAPFISLLLVLSGMIFPIILTKYLITKNRIMSLLLLGHSRASQK